jgi:RNA-dependent RNA polymerase
MIAGRHFRFLAYSNSGLRSHTFYFVAPFDYEETVDGTPPKVSSVRLDADAIRARLGEFTDDLCCPARYAARMSQLFSATDPSVCLSEDEVFSMKDSMSPPPYNSCYTDGVGTISPSLALEIHRALLPSPFLLLSSYALVASALQIRMGGYKGMVSTDPTIPGRCMFVRGSMRKFTSSSYDVEISKAFGEPSWSHLNRFAFRLLYRGLSQ